MNFTKNYSISTRRLIRVAGIIGMLLTPSSLLSFFYPNQENYELGYQHYTNEKYSEAIRFFKNSLEYDPNNLKTLNALANAYHKNIDFEKADEYYQKAIAETPLKDLARVPLLINHGNNYFKMEKFDLAIEQYKKALDIDDLNFSAKKNLEIASRKLQQQQAQNNQQNSSQDNRNDPQSQPSEGSEGQAPDDRNSSQQNQEGNQSEQFDKSQQSGKSDKSKEKSEQPNADTKNPSSGSPNQNSTPNPDLKSSKISLEQAEEILKAFSEKERKLKGYEFYKQIKPPQKNNKNW